MTERLIFQGTLLRHWNQVLQAQSGKTQKIIQCYSNRGTQHPVVLKAGCLHG